MFHDGLKVKKLNGVSSVYNDTVGTQINTQYIDKWNYMNGQYFKILIYACGTYISSLRYILAGETNAFDKSSGTLLTSDGYGAPKTYYRNLIRFQNLHEYIPNTATIMKASIIIPTTFTWDLPSSVQVCIMTKYWDVHNVG